MAKRERPKGKEKRTGPAGSGGFPLRAVRLPFGGMYGPAEVLSDAVKLERVIALRGPRNV